MTGFSAGITRQATIASRLWEPGSTFTISAGAAGGGPGSPFSVRWLKNGAPLVDGPGVSGSQTEILTVNNAAYADSGTYSFEVRSACGASRSSVFVTVRCAADVTGTGGQPDQSVTIEDLTAYLQLFQTGAGGADVDDGSGTGLLDRAVTVDDLLYFLQRYELGC